MWIAISYDIKKDKQRSHLAKELLQFGIRTQKSFFECDVSEKEINIIKRIIKKHSEPEDFVTIYQIRDSKRIGNVEYLEINDLVF